MRQEFWDWFCANANEHNLYFLFNDLWRFPVPDDIKDRVLDLKTCEDSIWNIAAGIARNNGKVIVYGVGFFAIGRLENLRSEIIHSNLSVFIFNAGEYGYDKYGYAHAFYKEDDLKVMSGVGFQIVPQNNYKEYLESFAYTATVIPQHYYLRSGAD